MHVGCDFSIHAEGSGHAYSRPVASITCQDCGTQRHRCPSNTLYCKRCRVLREVAYWAKHTRRCKDCRAKFAPLNRGDYWCSKCHPGLPAYHGACGLAISDKPHDGNQVYPQLPVCAACMRSPAMRKRLIAVLTRGQAQRRTDHAWTRETL